MKMMETADKAVFGRSGGVERLFHFDRTVYKVA